MKTSSHETVTWKVVAIHDETHDTKTLELEVALGEHPPFRAGQYLTVLLEGYLPLEGKSYSISSTPHAPHLSLTIKKMGTFSTRLLEHKVGDTLKTSLPYGFFYPEDDSVSDLVYVAGGIGITPCIGMIESLLTTKYPYPITLWYSNKTEADIIFKNRIQELKETYPQFTAHIHFTREASSDPQYTFGRIQASHIRENINDSTTTDFFICGSIDFTKTLWKDLKTEGINPNHLYTEGFF